MLNTFIKSKCNGIQCLRKIHLSELRDKHIIVDTSIYMYKFMLDNGIYEGFYNMCSIFIKYNITPLFVFDGKPPKEKEDELRKRSEDKKKAEATYNILKHKLKENKNDDDIEEIEQQMYNLRKKFVRVRTTDIDIVKSIIDAFGLQYMNAPNESDELCAYYALNNKVYAVMSEDMDMFIYGCPIVIRYLSVLKENCIVYNSVNIIKKLNMTEEHFKQMCILSGTDYKKQTDKNIFNFYRGYFMFQRSQEESLFKYFSSDQEDVNELNHIRDMFNVKNNEELSKYGNINIENKPMDMNKIKEIMETDNFIFI